MDFKGKLTKLKKCMKNNSYDNCIDKLLNERIIENRYELTGLTLEEIGYVMGITRERVRQIEENAYRKIRKEIVRNPKLRSIFDSLL